MNRRSLAWRRDDGVSLILVAFMLVALIGMAALVIDVAALVQERRTLQNGADAAALAVAVDCSKGNCGASYTTADTYADANADDGLANIASVCGVGPGLTACATPPAGVTGNYVSVTTSTLSSGGSSLVRFLFAPVLGGGSGRTVTRTAVVAWGRLGAATTLPITISMCEWNSIVGDVSSLPKTDQYIYLHGTGGVGQPTCNPTANNSDKPLSGGFGYLDTSSCLVAISADGWVSADPGNDGLPKGCNPSLLQNANVVMPIYNGSKGTGSNGQYSIGGFALFHITGYKFQGSSSWGMTRCPKGNGNSAVCLKGDFLKYSMQQGDLISGGTDYGVTVTKLVA